MEEVAPSATPPVLKSTKYRVRLHIRRLGDGLSSRSRSGGDFASFPHPGKETERQTPASQRNSVVTHAAMWQSQSDENAQDFFIFLIDDNGWGPEGLFREARESSGLARRGVTGLGPLVPL